MSAIAGTVYAGGTPAVAITDIPARLGACYRAIAAGPMAGLPICHPRLGVAALGFRRVGEQAVGVVVTPWFMNIVAAPLATIPPAPLGATVQLALPAGAFDLIVGDLAGFGRLDAASLFSPMHEFADMAAAVETAESAAAALFAAPALDRRSLLRGRLRPA
jgi:[NiFe] hydrogenase assembly HybE family chaperone